jgi:flagellar biosynthetic protein FlhB
MDSASDKSHQPTPKKLQDARKKGEIPRSQEIGIATTYLSLTLVLMLMGKGILEDLTPLLSTFFLPTTYLEQVRATPSNFEETLQTTRTVGLVIAPLLVIPLALIVLTILAQRSAIIVASNIAPKLERISPIAGFRKKFGPNGIFEFLKSFSKLTLYIFALVAFLLPQIDEIVGVSRLFSHSGIAFLLDKSLALLIIATAISIALAVVDYVWQRSQFTKKNMMSFQDLKDEQKDAEGDPHFKSARRQRALEISSNRMLIDVQEADVVIVNPTHFAVALEWDPLKSRAPIIVAKGQDEIALKIKYIAEIHNIPIYKDIPTARNLVTSSSIGDEIPIELYQAVAAAIKFAQKSQPKKEI